MDAACNGLLFYETPKLILTLDLEDPLSVSNPTDWASLEGEWA